MKSEPLFFEPSIEEPVKKVKKFKNPDIELCMKFFDEFYIPKYTELFGIPPRINFGRDVKFVKKIIKDYKDTSMYNCENMFELLVKVCEIFFTNNSTFVLKSAWDIQSFHYLFQSLVLNLKQKKDNAITPIIDGYKCAYLNHYGEKIDNIIDESIFTQIYIYIKPLYEQYGKHLNYSLKRFSELFFLVGFDYIGKRNYGINFFITDVAKNLFNNWINTEDNNLAIFYTSGVGHLTKDQLELKRIEILEEDKKLLLVLN